MMIVFRQRVLLLRSLLRSILLDLTKSGDRHLLPLPFICVHLRDQREEYQQLSQR